MGEGQTLGDLGRLVGEMVPELSLKGEVREEPRREKGQWKRTSSKGWTNMKQRH